MYNPFITAVMSYFLIGERLSRYDYISFCFCLAGVLALTNPFGSSDEKSNVQSL